MKIDRFYSSIYLLIILIEISLIESNPLKFSDINQHCDVCQFDQYHNSTTGYQCYYIDDDQTLCTCPDQLLSTINRPCRICQRDNQCGSSATFCSEQSNILSSKPNVFFACFCSNGQYFIGEPCPDQQTSTILTNSPSSTTTTTTSVTTSTTTITTTITTTRTTSEIVAISTTTTILDCSTPRNGYEKKEICLISMLIMMIGQILLLKRIRE